MKLLFDDNISYRIVKKLAEIFPGCLHVSRTNLPVPASDRGIWEYARQNSYLIITFDEDFKDFLTYMVLLPKS
nr:DUF5615 family PIN-like protein [Arundinibacter roseus]